MIPPRRYVTHTHTHTHTHAKKAIVVVEQNSLFDWHIPFHLNFYTHCFFSVFFSALITNTTTK